MERITSLSQVRVLSSVALISTTVNTYQYSPSGRDSCMAILDSATSTRRYSLFLTLFVIFLNQKATETGELPKSICISSITSPTVCLIVPDSCGVRALMILSWDTPEKCRANHDCHLQPTPLCPSKLLAPRNRLYHIQRPFLNRVGAPSSFLLAIFQCCLLGNHDRISPQQALFKNH